jgi:hypothetical protein
MFVVMPTAPVSWFPIWFSKGGQLKVKYSERQYGFHLDHYCTISQGAGIKIETSNQATLPPEC